MKNLYNKGRFRNHEYGKIPSYLKRLGNKKWRRSANNETIDLNTEVFFETKVQIPQKASRSKERIKVKITFSGYNETKTSRYVTYKNRRAFNDSIKRNNVLHVVFKNNKQ